jgi:hypothetical protein
MTAREEALHRRLVGELVTVLRIGPVPGGWEMAEAALASVEPIIRADERRECETDWHPNSAVGYVKMRANIEAEVRERIAQEVEALADGPWGNLIEVDRAARIARGGAQ